MFKYRNIVMAIATVLGLVTATFAAGEPYQGQAWIGEHNVQQQYPLHLRIAPANRHDASVEVHINGLDMTTDLVCVNNWSNDITVTGTGPYTFIATDPGQDPAFVGLSADIDCGYRKVDAGFKGLSKIGVYKLPADTAATVTYLKDEWFYQTESGKVRVANVLLEGDTSTKFVIKALANTVVKAMLGSISLDECKVTGAADAADCTFNAPKGTVFKELGQGMYVALTVSYNGTPPTSAVVIGLDLP